MAETIKFKVERHRSKIHIEFYHEYTGYAIFDALAKDLLEFQEALNTAIEEVGKWQIQHIDIADEKNSDDS